MTKPSRRPFGEAGHPLSELSDQALLQEAQARRLRRHAGGATDGNGPSAPGQRAAQRPRQVRQWLANLELEQDAEAADVEQAYDSLLTRYGRAATDADPARRAAARALIGSLKQAHEGLLLYFSRAR